MGDPGEILVEPKRRRVFRAVAGWGVASFAVLQTVEPVLHVDHLPEWMRTVVVTLSPLASRSRSSSPGRSTSPGRGSPGPSGREAPSTGAPSIAVLPFAKLNAATWKFAHRRAAGAARLSP